MYILPLSLKSAEKSADLSLSDRDGSADFSVTFK